MGNPWEEIDLDDYEKYMGLDSVSQLQTMNQMMKNQFYAYPVQSVMILGIAGGNGTYKYADLLVANLFIEYVGYECFQKTVTQIKAQYVSCIIQVNTDVSFVSDSPYIRIFDRLDEVHHQMDENALTNAMSEIGYKKDMREERGLPNEKKLVRIDFRR